MAKRSSKLVTGCVVTIIVIVAVIFVVGYPFRSSTALKISFITVTNDVALGFLATFVATNESNEEITFAGYAPQIKRQGIWSKLTSAGDITTLPAHTAGTFTIPAATNCEAWREPVLWVYDRASETEQIRSGVKANLYFNWLRASRGQWPHYYNNMGGVGYTAFSAEITNTPGK
jgi:hypothetical protein